MNLFQGVKTDIQQGAGYSPDGGRLWREGDLIYWEDGHVVDLTKVDSYIIRYMRLECGENFSLWTDEKRDQVRAERAKERAEYKQREDDRRIERTKLVASAEAKLTEDEIQALVEHYRE